MSDEYNFDDFEDFDSEQKETAKANGKSAKSYARNVLKSAKYIGLDVIKNFDPDIRDFLSDTGNIFTDMYDVVENAKKTVKDTIDKIFGSDSSTLETVKQIAKNTFDDLRTGQFYNQERQDAIFNDMFGGDMSFGWDDDSKDSDDDSDSKKESKDISNTEMTNRISSSQQLSGMNTASMIIANDNKNTKISMSANMQMFNATNQTLLGINTSLINIQQGLVNPLQTHIQNFNKFATVATEQLAKQTKYLSILASQIQKKDSNKQNFGENKEIESYNDIFGYGALPNIYNWANHVKEKIKQESSTLTSMAEFLSPEMIKMFVSSFASSPIATLLSMATSGALKATFVGKEVEKTKRIVKNTILQAAFGIHEERLKNSDGIVGYLAKVLDIIPNTNYKTSFSKYNKGASDWTGKDQKALRDVIPTQLSTIISILSGTEAKIFDYDKGRWFTASRYQSVFQKDKVSQVLSDNEITALKDEIIKDIVIERNEELIKEKGDQAIAETNEGRFTRSIQRDFDTLLNLLAIRNIEPTDFSDKQEFLNVIKRYKWTTGPNKMLSEKNIERIANTIFANPSTVVRFKDGIIRGKISRAKYIDQLSSSNSAILNLINRSGLSDVHKLGINNRFGSDILIKTVDENKHNIFYYLAEILNNIKNIQVTSTISSGISSIPKRVLERKIAQPSKTTTTANQTKNQNKQSASNDTVDIDTRRLDPNSKYYDPDYAAEIAVMKERYIDLGDDLGYGQVVKETTEDGITVFKQVDTSSSYTTAANYVDRLKRDRAISRGTIEYAEDYDKKKIKGLIQTVLEDFNAKLESFAYGDMSKTLKEKYKDAHGFTGVMERTGQIIKEQFQKLSDYFKGLWEKFKVSEWGENFFGTLKQKGKNLGSSIWDYVKERTFDIIEGITGTRPGEKKIDLSGAKNDEEDKKKKDSNAANPSQAAFGGVIRKSGMASVSEGEIIIPANKNPYYEDRLSSAQRQKIENKNYMAWVDDGAPGGPYFGSFRHGTPNWKKKAKQLSESSDPVLNHTIRRRIQLLFQRSFSNIKDLSDRDLVELANVFPEEDRYALLNNQKTQLTRSHITRLERMISDAYAATLINNDMEKILTLSNITDVSLPIQTKLKLIQIFRRQYPYLSYKWFNKSNIPKDLISDTISANTIGRDFLRIQPGSVFLKHGKDVWFDSSFNDKYGDDIVSPNLIIRPKPYQVTTQSKEPVSKSNNKSKSIIAQNQRKNIPNNITVTNKAPSTSKASPVAVVPDNQTPAKPGVPYNVPYPIISNNKVEQNKEQPVRGVTTRALKDLVIHGWNKYSKLALLGALGYGGYQYGPQMLDYLVNNISMLNPYLTSSLGLLTGISSGIKSKSWRTGLVTGAASILGSSFANGMISDLIPTVQTVANMIDPQAWNDIKYAGISGLGLAGLANPTIQNILGKTGEIVIKGIGKPILAIGNTAKAVYENAVEAVKNSDIVKYGHESDAAYTVVKELENLGFESSDPQKLIDLVNKNAQTYANVGAKEFAERVIKKNKNDEWLYRRSGGYFTLTNNDKERIFAKRIIYRLNNGNDKINTLIHEDNLDFLDYIFRESSKIRRKNPKITDEELIETIASNIKQYKGEFDQIHNGDRHVSKEGAALFKLLFAEDNYIAEYKEQENINKRDIQRDLNVQSKDIRRKYKKAIDIIAKSTNSNISSNIESSVLNYIKNNSDGKLTPEDVASKVQMTLKFGSSFMQNLDQIATQNDLDNNDADKAREYLSKNIKLRNLLYRTFNIDMQSEKSKKYLIDAIIDDMKAKGVTLGSSIQFLKLDKDKYTSKYSERAKIKNGDGGTILNSLTKYDNDRTVSDQEYRYLLSQQKDHPELRRIIPQMYKEYGSDRKTFYERLEANFKIGEIVRQSDIGEKRSFDPIRSLSNVFDKLFGTLANQNVDLKALTISTLDTFKKDYAWITGSGLIGGAIGALATGSPLGVLGGLLLGGGLEVVDRSQQWTDILYGKKHEKTGRYVGGFLSPKIATFMKEKMPNMAKAGALGGAAGMLFGGPLGVLGGITLGSGLEYLRASSNFKEYFFGKDEISDKSKFDRIREFARKHNFGIKGAALGGALGYWAGGPVGIIGGSLLGAATEYLSGATGLTNFLLGERDINGERRGGLVGALNQLFGGIPRAIYDSVTTGLTTLIKDSFSHVTKYIYYKWIDPVSMWFKEKSSKLFNNVVGYFRNKMTNWGQTAYEYLTNTRWGKWMKEHALTPIQNVSTAVSRGWNKLTSNWDSNVEQWKEERSIDRFRKFGEITNTPEEMYSILERNGLLNNDDRSKSELELFTNIGKDAGSDDNKRVLKLMQSIINNSDMALRHNQSKRQLYRTLESTLESENINLDDENKSKISDLYKNMSLSTGNSENLENEIRTILDQNNVSSENIDKIVKSAKENNEYMSDTQKKFTAAKLELKDLNQNAYDLIEKYYTNIYDDNGYINQDVYMGNKSRMSNLIKGANKQYEKTLDAIENEGNPAATGTPHNSYEQTKLVWDTTKNWLNKNVGGLTTEIRRLKHFFTGSSGNAKLDKNIAEDKKNALTQSPFVKAMAQAMADAINIIQQSQTSKDNENPPNTNEETQSTPSIVPENSNNANNVPSNQNGTQSNSLKITSMSLISDSETEESVKGLVKGLVPPPQGSDIGGDSSINTRIPGDISTSVNTTSQGTTINITNVIPPPTVTTPTQPQTNQTQNTNISNNTSGITKVEFFEGQPIQYVRTNNGDWTYNLQDRQTRETVAYIRRRNQAFENLANGTIGTSNGTGQSTGSNNNSSGKNNGEESVGKSILSTLMSGFGGFSKLITPITIATVGSLPFIASYLSGSKYDPGMYRGADINARREELSKANIFEKISTGSQAIDNVLLNKDMRTYNQGDYVSGGIFNDAAMNDTNTKNMNNLINNKYTRRMARNFFDSRSAKYMGMIEKLSNIKYIGNVFKPLKWAGQAGQMIREGKFNEFWNASKKARLDKFKGWMSDQKMYSKKIGQLEKYTTKINKITAKGSIGKIRLAMTKMSIWIESVLSKILLKLSEFKVGLISSKSKLRQLNKWVMKLLQRASKHSIVKVFGKLAKIALHTPVINWLFIAPAVFDCLFNGSFKTRVILGIISEPTWYDKVFAAILHGLNEAIPWIGGLVPTKYIVTWGIAFLHWLFGWNFGNLVRDRRIAEKTVEEYNRKNGTTYDVEEYIYNVLGDRPWLQNTWLGKTVGKAWNWTTDKLSYSWDYLWGNDLSKYVQTTAKKEDNKQNIPSPEPADMEMPNGSGSGIHTIQKGNNTKFGNSDISTSGCGPAAATTVLKAYGINTDLKNAAKYAEDRNYVTDTASRYTASGTTGTKASYFSDIFGANGIGTDYTNDKSAIQSAIDMGSPTVLLGQDSMNHSKSNSPFGPNPHYVVAQGRDKSGNIIVDDPELNKTTTYRKNILDNTSLGILTGGESDVKPKDNKQKLPNISIQKDMKLDPYTEDWEHLTDERRKMWIKWLGGEGNITDKAIRNAIIQPELKPAQKKGWWDKLWAPTPSEVVDPIAEAKKKQKQEELIKRMIKALKLEGKVIDTTKSNDNTKDKKAAAEEEGYNRDKYQSQDLPSTESSKDNTDTGDNDNSGGLLGLVGKFFTSIKNTVSNSNLSEYQKKYIGLVFSDGLIGDSKNNNEKQNEENYPGEYENGDLPYKPIVSMDDFRSIDPDHKGWFSMGNSDYNKWSMGSLIDRGYNDIIGLHSTLPNCVGWALGRFNWIYQELTQKKNKYLIPGNACDFYANAPSLGLNVNKTEPQPGAIMCFSGGKSGAGHVAIVEQVLEDGNKIVVSESQYSGETYYTWSARRNDHLGGPGIWSYTPSYTFQGFIYNPGVQQWIKRMKAVPANSKDGKCEKDIWDQLIDLGFSEYAAAGILGNIWAESQCNPDRIEGDYVKSLATPALKLRQSLTFNNLGAMNDYTNQLFRVYDIDGVDYYKGGYATKLNNKSYYVCGLGLCQWTASRAINLLKFANSKGKSWRWADVQISFLIKELRDEHLASKPSIEDMNIITYVNNHTNSPENAAIVIASMYIGNTVNGQQARKDYARKVYARRASKKVEKTEETGSGSRLLSPENQNDLTKSLTEYAKTSKNNTLKDLSSIKKNAKNNNNRYNKPQSNPPMIDFTKKSNYSKSFDKPSQSIGYGSGSSSIPNRHNSKQNRYNINGYSSYNDSYPYGGIGSGSGRPSVRNNQRYQYQNQSGSNEQIHRINRNTDSKYIDSLIDLSKIVTYLETIATNTKYNALLAKLVEILEKRAIESNGNVSKNKSTKPFLSQNLSRAIASDQINIEDELSLILEKMSRVIAR